MIIHWQLTFGLLLVLYISSSIGRKDLKVHTSKCPMLTECPYRAQQCSEDDDCSVDSICCKSPCGKVCTKQLFTGCQTLKNAASRRAKSLGVEEKSVRSPRCNKSGGFEPIQCDNEIVSSCWCVDEAGFELAGTRAPAAALVNCTAPKPCADHTCRMFCPHGFALDHDGCPLCRCRDPCSDIKCPNALECQLEDLACADPPCPPVPTCKKGRSLDSICPVGDPLRISETVRPFLCGNDPGKPTCPPLYQCLVQKGNDYGVCCPASLKVQKSGTCPVEDDIAECGIPCKHDLECQSIQKCCSTTKCGSTCVHPKNVTECTHQRSLSELLSVSERAGRGYVPQCSPDGEFEPKQCSRNGLVCWCVDRMGRKIRGSMGPSDSVSCDRSEADRFDTGRSLDKVGNDNQCQKLECAAICEYGFKLDENGCHTCKCDDPCDGYVCPEDEECISVKESNCTDFLCPSLPVCRPKAVYANPCESGAPLTDDMSGAPVACALKDEDGTICPTNYQCKAVLGSTQAVCCPMTYELEAEESAGIDVTEGRSQTMCEYLRDFSDSMEGTREGMNLALPIPTCNEDGNFIAMQCDEDQCWCVDNFGTEIPRTRGNGNSTKDCDKLRETMDCLDLTCRMGCEYGFVLSEETGCPLCQCRDPCHDVKCRSDEQCQLVEVNCKDHYCPPVPACLPKKLGQCPYLVPSNSISCDFSCNSDLACNGTMKCCSNGCGTQCAEPLLYTACQHKRTLAQYQAHESGVPPNRLYIPSCNEDGTFAKKQCNLGTGQCWCVDQNGFELSGSRGTKTLDCDNPPSPSDCPLRKCSENCEHGYKIDENGCRTCECINPCDDVKCRGDGETCRLVAVECVSSFCPPVPMCLPKKENPCQTGEPLTFDDEVVTCGPEEETCPSSHKCQLSPIGEYAVCCPKPRGICFEPLDKGDCGDQEPRNLTRFYFNSRTNKCDIFTFSGCQGNHNNFYTKELCNQVCPVLSQCERLREKNQKAAEKYNKPNFLPRCENETGNWQPVQCLEHVGVCWCVTPQGTPLKGSLTRGAEPDCNFRQARNRAQNRADFISDADLVLEELMMQIGSLDDVDEPADLDNNVNAEVKMQSTISRCEDLGGQCDENKKFLPMQCEGQICWCVDEAGNQLPLTNTFMKGERICLFSPVEKVEVTLGFRGEYDDIASVPVVNRLSKIVKNLGGVINDDGITADITSDALFIRFFLIGNKKIDIAYTLEQMVMNQHLPALTADITKSRVVHHLVPHNSVLRDNALSLENREIVSQSPVSVVAPYHTALIVVAAASAFVISILTLLVMLYRRKMNQLNSNNKVVDDSRFLSNTRPIYIELPNEKYNSLSSDLNKQSA